MVGNDAVPSPRFVVFGKRSPADGEGQFKRKTGRGGEVMALGYNVAAIRDRGDPARFT